MTTKKPFLLIAAAVLAVALTFGVTARATAAEATPCTDNCVTAMADCFRSGGSTAVCGNLYDCCMAACGQPNPGYPCKPS